MFGSLNKSVESCYNLFVSSSLRLGFSLELKWTHLNAVDNFILPALRVYPYAFSGSNVRKLNFILHILWICHRWFHAIFARIVRIDWIIVYDVISMIWTFCQTINFFFYILWNATSEVCEARIIQPFSRENERKKNCVFVRFKPLKRRCFIAKGKLNEWNRHGTDRRNFFIYVRKVR